MFFRVNPDRRCRSGGFTLMELMVVLVIIAIIVSFATLSIGDAGRGERIGTEARRIAALSELAGEEAVLNARQLGLALTPEGYQFLELGEEAWRPIGGDPLLRPRELSEDIAVELLIEGMPVSSEQDEKAPQPQVIFASSGERTPFEMTFGPADRYGELDEEEGTLYHLEGGPFGPIRLTGPGIKPLESDSDRKRRF